MCKQEIEDGGELEEPTEAAVSPTGMDAQAKGPRKSFGGGVRRQLSDDELNSPPAVQKFLLDEIERLESELSRAKDFAERFHTADKNEAVLKEKLKTHTGVEILSGAALTSGGAIIIGFVVSIWENQPTAGGVFLAGGIALLAGGLVAKVIKL